MEIVMQQLLCFAAGLNQLAKRVYDWVMKKFIATNGREVLKAVTPSGVTVSMDTSVPLEALEAMQKKLQADLSVDEHAATGHRRPVKKPHQK
ncbi:hypothetical protein [Paraburkholderia fungorum]|jgi:hypothetical protein|uniref:Uncharacterized protein n=2 Tax=Paraburkholderia fungorum TaxID=134537 RepID=A0AAW3V2J6_9BURK|nr:hypothetical protein [Paraburkholderia fungorum]MBB4516386.1 hypothetical protein [Paraburkholderia fungorum]MBB5546704.1 hypothetical protein [Paraburkholderia fungorum]MBB6205142.1 hypothetical protein [Paraburkholderia fungorum]MBU7440744.1 hypothetical protein [Paraburkholderia fungorum]MDE1007352.1 hypothetical protein [Paraburkholderia fungorum]